MQGDYVFADLQGKEQLLHEIQQLEDKIQQETRQEINLIAYSKKTAHPKASLSQSSSIHGE